MLEDVGQRLLHDPVRREVDARGQAVQVPDGLQFDRDAGRPHLGHQVVQPAQTRLRRDRAVVPAGEQAEQPAHLGQPLAARVLDGRQRGTGGVGVGVDGPLAGLGLDDDDAHAVRDEVVQLAGDAGAFVGDRLRRVRRPVLLGVLGPAARSAVSRRRERIQRPRPQMPARTNQAGTTSSTGSPARSFGTSPDRTTTAVTTRPTSAARRSAWAPTA